MDKKIKNAKIYIEICNFKIFSIIFMEKSILNKKNNLKQELYQKFGIQDLGIDDNDIMRSLMAWYPNKKFYQIKSAKSGKNIIALYSENTFMPVYSHDEWNSDDYISPYLNIDFSKSFFEQFHELQKIAPVIALLSNMQENAEFCQDSEGLKNCYTVFDSLNCRDVYYSVRIYNSNSCIDVYWVMDSELLYDCVYMFSCYNTKYSFHCKQVSDSCFLYDCRNTQNSFMCFGLRNQKYCVYNKQYTKLEYENFINNIDFTNYEEMMKYKKYFLEEIISKNRQNVNSLDNCEDSEGAYIKNCSKVSKAYESFNLKDSYNVFQCGTGRDILHAFMCNDRVELCFQSSATGIDVYNTRNCVFTWHSSDMQYCYLCINCNNCFGCVGLKRKSYCIFNKQYTKEEYFEKRDQLIAHMKRTGEYDKFFPINLSPFKYEDTIAYDFFDLNKANTFYKEYELLKNSGYEINENSIQICQISAKNFKFIEPELKFYKKYKIPLPKIDFAMRYKQRMEMM